MKQLAALLGIDTSNSITCLTDEDYATIIEDRERAAPATGGH